jgi:ATP-binding cassette subfamily B protein
MFIWGPYFTQQIIDLFFYGESAEFNRANRQDLLFTLLGAMVLFNFVRTIIFYSGNMLYEHSSQGLIYRVRAHLFRNMQAQDAQFFDVYRTGDIMTRLSGDIEMVRHSVAWIIKSIVECIFLFSASAVYFFILDPLMAVCMLALTPVILLISSFFRKKVRPLYTELRERLSELNTNAEENISGNRVVKAFAREDFEIDRFAKKNTEYKDANQTAALTWLKYFPSLEITAQALSVIQLLMGGIFVINGSLTFGEFTAFAGLIWTISNPMRMIGNIVNDLQRFTASANKIIEVYYNRPVIVDRPDTVAMKEHFDGELEFRNVSFRYGRSDVLKDVSFKVKPGQTVAVMGETGTGKTSLINLIPRIYDPQEGGVYIDGVNIRHMNLNRLRKNIGVATQDVLLYSDTVEGNIAFGNMDMPFDEVQRCADLAAADGFIRKMSDGYDTIVGERGVGLSGGQKQRVALARALATKPSILILDDTTSAVDLETEKHIQESLNNLDFGCTKIIVAQRISSTKDADCIIVLQNGSIAEMGTHDELLKLDGYYKEVFDLQNGTYSGAKSETATA